MRDVKLEWPSWNPRGFHRKVSFQGGCYTPFLLLVGHSSALRAAEGPLHVLWWVYLSTHHQSVKCETHSADELATLNLSSLVYKLALAAIPELLGG